MCITDYIPKGRNNAISRARLCMLTGKSDRANRKQIQDARNMGVPIIANTEDGGYYISDDPAEIRRLKLEYLSRAHSCQHTARQLDKLAVEVNQERFGGI